MLRIFIGLCSFLIVGVASSHQQKESYSTIQFNERTKKLEVMHRFYIHDAEHALNMVNGSKADILLDKEAQAAFASYVQQAFDLKDSDEKTVVLSFVGFEVEGKYLWIYEESNRQPPFKGFWVKMSALQDIWPGQTNQINFELNNQVKAVRLKADDRWKYIELN